MENVLNSISDLKANNTIEGFVGGLNHVQDVVIDLTNEINRLEQSRLIYGTLHFRKDQSGNPKYCYAVHSVKGKNKREREYIGTDEDKIKDALDAISRAKRLEYLKTEVKRLEREYDHLHDLVTDLKRAFLNFKIETETVDK